MSGLLITVIVIFFAVGITFGVITVHAASALRAERRSQPDYGSPHKPEAEVGQEDQLLRWPGHGDHDFRDW